MTGPFGDDEFFEDEWVDVYDVEGHKTSLRHLATVRLNGKTYMILGEITDEFPEKGRLMLVREDQTVDGMKEYVVAHDPQEVEHVIGHFTMRVLMDHIDQLPEELAHDLENMDLQDMQPDDPDAPEYDVTCGCIHRPGEFCFCGDNGYLQ